MFMFRIDYIYNHIQLLLQFLLYLIIRFYVADYR